MSETTRKEPTITTSSPTTSSPVALACVSPVIEGSESPTPAQVACALHVLRNLAAAFGGAIALLDSKREEISATDLLSCLDGALPVLTKITTSLHAGSWCFLAPHECEFVSPFVGCSFVQTERPEVVETTTESSVKG